MIAFAILFGVATQDGNINKALQELQNILN